MADSGHKRKPVGTQRRSVLKLGLLGAGGVALGLPVARVGLWWNRRPADGLKALSLREFEITEAIAEAYFPPGGTPPQSGKELNLAMFLDEVVARMDSDLARVMKAGLHTIEDFTMLDQLSSRRFDDLPLNERYDVLVSWEQSPVFPKRGVLRLLKWYLSMALVERPGTLEALDIDYICG